MVGYADFLQNDGNAYEPVWTIVTDKYNNIDIGESARPALSISMRTVISIFSSEPLRNDIFLSNDGTKQTPAWKFITDQYADICLIGGMTPTFTDIDADGDFDFYRKSYQIQA